VRFKAFGSVASFGTIAHCPRRDETPTTPSKHWRGALTSVVDEDWEVEGGAEPGEGPVAALLKEFASMRLKMLPKKGDLRDLNNWRGIMLLDAASKTISMVINGRLQRLLKEVGIEEQNGFMGDRSWAARNSLC
jgi:hypothetical protein